jgi:hypothetical protein
MALLRLAITNYKASFSIFYIYFPVALVTPILTSTFSSFYISYNKGSILEIATSFVNIFAIAPIIWVIPDLTTAVPSLASEIIWGIRIYNFSGETVVINYPRLVTEMHLTSFSESLNKVVKI